MHVWCVLYIAAFHDCKSPPYIPNSSITWLKRKPTGNGTFTSDKVWVQCNKGLVYRGSLPLLCVGNGQWSGGESVRKSYRITLSHTAGAIDAMCNRELLF